MSDVITLDGPRMAGTTLVGAGLERALSEFGPRLEIAGRFFYQVTAAVLDKLEDPMALNDGAVLEDATQEVIDHGTWEQFGDTKSPVLDDHVSRVSQSPHVQKAGEAWYDRVTKQAEAEGTGLLIVDGHNSRDHLRGWLGRTGASLALDLIVDCKPESAARRRVQSEHFPGDDEFFLPATLDLTNRDRQQDAERSTHPHVIPSDTVKYTVDTTPQAAIAESRRAADSTGLPRPILLDATRHPNTNRLVERAVDLARAALV